MSKIYKGWELMRDIAEGKIEEGSEFNIYEDKEMYFDRPAIYANGVLRHNGILVTEFVSLEKMMQLDFERIEEEQDIDIQTIEEIEWNEINGVGEEQDKFILSKGEKYLCSNYNDFEMVAILTINNLIEAVKKLDRKMNSSGQ